MKELTLEATHTHLYPGHRGSVRGALPAPGRRTGAPCQIRFSDGSMALAALRITHAGEGLLEAGAYVTAAGTAIPAKRWRLALSQDPEGNSRFRVLAKLDAA